MEEKKMTNSVDEEYLVENEDQRAPIKKNPNTLKTKLLIE